MPIATLYFITQGKGNNELHRDILAYIEKELLSKSEEYKKQYMALL